MHGLADSEQYTAPWQLRVAEATGANWLQVLHGFSRISNLYNSPGELQQFGGIRRSKRKFIGWRPTGGAVFAIGWAITVPVFCSPPDSVLSILRVWVFDRFIDAVVFRQHAVVKDAGHKNPSHLAQIEDDVPAARHTTQSVRNLVARAPNVRPLGKYVTARFKIEDVTSGLSFAPSLDGVSADVWKVPFRGCGQPKGRHDLVLVFSAVKMLFLFRRMAN